MDLGPQWPFWLQLLLSIVVVVLLAWFAVRHANAVRQWPAAVLSLLAWAGSAILLWRKQGAICIAGSRQGIIFPGCDWEYQPAPTDAGDLVLFIVMGGAVNALRLGLPLAAAIFAARWGFLRLRRVAG